MDQDSRYKVLIVDDALDNIKILIDLLHHDYTTFFAKSGKKAIELARSIRPDIILLDIVMPEMDGYEVCERLKSEKSLSDIPVIFISAKNQVGDETRGLDLGAVDYITKPVSPPILKARIRNHLKLSNAMKELKLLYSMALDASPLTGLPGNNSIAKRIESALAKNEKICVVYTDLDNFKAYNDKYGFAKGDEVILFNSYILQSGLKSNGLDDCFIGHIGGDDFVITLPVDKVNDVMDTIICSFDEGITNFYNSEDLANKAIVSCNRCGEKQQFPLITISMAGVDITAPKYEKYIQVNDACSEGKKRAKAIEGSVFVMERRKGNGV
ncbi:Response regulator receiver modulated diguanylate cyclase [Desulfamplus magnetovallimortis]|uniref:Response regulator receiver modulated diguanylate cyclase n=1 Tax=Desulfamplus magnetovallimortis TaxID=1246637 RepID=A0A1W1H786_9BACT|nr:response regulator [Desulfamplus magnetovallimortis]SLM28350.1 Response regulator receiver modulated diguanylate cyclase [Desulfamplus magnetovallimortis]